MVLDIFFGKCQIVKDYEIRMKYAKIYNFTCVTSTNEVIYCDIVTDIVLIWGILIIIRKEYHYILNYLKLIKNILIVNKKNKK